VRRERLAANRFGISRKARRCSVRARLRRTQLKFAATDAAKDADDLKTAMSAFETKKRNETFKRCNETVCGATGPGGAVMHTRRFARVRPTGRISDLAKLILDPKAPVIDCRVVDYSPGGACLEISPQIKVPNRFELLFGTTRKRCRVVWSAGRRLGVAF